MESKGVSVDSYEINPSERKALFFIISLQDSPNECVSSYLVEVNIGIRKLVARGFIKIVEKQDHHREIYSAYEITNDGGAWILHIISH